MTTTVIERGGTTDAVYAFGPFEFDPQRRLLRCEGKERRLTTRAHDVLLCLLERHGQLATKSQLLDAAWRGVVVEESSLTQAIHELRRVLGEKPRDRRYILTVPGRGYQFVAEVRVLARPEPGIEPAPAPAAAAPAPPLRVRAASGDGPSMLAASLAIAAAWGMSVLVLLWPARIETQPAPAATSHAELRATEARFFLQRRGPSDVDRAEASLRAALEQDANSAKVWSGLAGVHAIRASDVRADGGAELRRMRDAAERALQLDPNDAQALVRMAMYHYSDGDARKASRLVAAAAKVAPNDPLVLGVQAGCAALGGRLEDAVRLQRLAVLHAPLSAVDRLNLAHYLHAAGYDDEARESFETARNLAAHPDSVLARDAAVGIARIDVTAGRLDEARAVVSAMPASLERDYGLALVEHAARNRVAADAALERVRVQAGPGEAFRLAELHAFRGELDAAFHWLGVSAQATATKRQAKDLTSEMQNSPLLADARNDPRWQEWLAANR